LGGGGGVFFFKKFGFEANISKPSFFFLKLFPWGGGGGGCCFHNNNWFSNPIFTTWLLFLTNQILI